MKGVYTEQAPAARSAGSSGHAPRALSLMRASPAFGSYLAALAVLPFRWLSPAGSLQQHADWTDILVAVAAALWLLERLRAGTLLRSLRIWQLPLALYLILAVVAYAFAAPGRGVSATTVLLMAELAVLSVITADFAAQPQSRTAIAKVIAAAAAVTVVLGALGLALFHAGVHSGLVGDLRRAVHPIAPLRTGAGGIRGSPAAGELLHLRLGSGRERRRRTLEAAADRLSSSSGPAVRGHALRAG